MYIVLSYDITSNRRRAKLARMLVNYGTRVQKSVFEFRLGEKEFLEMQRDVKRTIHMEKDSVRYYFLCERCMGRIEIDGMGTITEDEETMIV